MGPRADRRKTTPLKPTARHGYCSRKGTPAISQMRTPLPRGAATNEGNVAAETLMRGLSAETVPPEYAGGLEGNGVRSLEAFVRAGGTLICLDQSGAFAIDAFKLPIKDVARVPREQFYGPGSILRIDPDPAHPLAYGMPAHSAAFFASSSAYDVSPGAGVQTAVRYADKDLLISGWLQGEPVIAGRSAVVQVPLGNGAIVLLGFPVQHRGQSIATFRILFNAIFAAAR
jgi:hypothetical protein